MASRLQIDCLSLSYMGPQGLTKAVDNLSIDVGKGDIACLVGPSGCGKSSLLRAIAGFVEPSMGRILIDGHVVTEGSVCMPPEQRGVGMVFQDYALFPHLTVEANILFGLTRGRPKEATAAHGSRAKAMLELVGLAELHDRMPHELSGGQAQRVALARALAPEPQIILLDEPFSSLDPSLRARLAREVREILKAAKTTAIVVTHDQTEAFTMADQLGVMFEGRVVQWGSPYEVYHEPCSVDVARFIGEGALISGRQCDHSVTTLLGSLPLADCCCDEEYPEKLVRVLLRPDDVVHDDDSSLKAKVVQKNFRGADFLYTLELPNGERILSLVPSHHDHPLNEPIGIRLEVDHVVTFSQEEQPQAFKNN